MTQTPGIQTPGIQTPGTSATGTTSTAPRKAVPTRRINLDDTFADVPRHFAVDGDLVLSHYAAALSAVFPDGEDFFVRSVRHFRDQISDPDLKRQVAGFIGQEAMHGREHRVFNQRLAELGYPSKQVEWLTRQGLKARSKLGRFDVFAKSNLAATAALEHFTATLAELVLSSEETRALFGSDAVRDLFVWHALEETEHKAVAFDVYKAVGGTERMRVTTMNFLRYGFVLGMGLQIAASLLMDPATYRRGNLRKSWRNFRRTPLMRKELWDKLAEYNRPDFHPEERDTRALIEYWRTELFGESGTLKDKLTGQAA